MKTAVVDIDNTLWHFCDALYRRLSVLNITVPTPDGWADWNFWERFCSVEEFMDAINDVHLNQDHEDHQPYPEARRFLSGLRDAGYRVVIASHRLPESRNQTERWLNLHGLAYEELHLSQDKTVLFSAPVDVVVDDAPPVLEAAKRRNAITTGLLFPWNRSFGGNGHRLFLNLDEVLEYIVCRPCDE
jgi:hypothetical protein